MAGFRALPDRVKQMAKLQNNNLVMLILYVRQFGEVTPLAKLGNFATLLSVRHVGEVRFWTLKR